jgi:hypothetical protein
MDVPPPLVPHLELCRTQKSLADRIEAYQPEAIVSVLKRIKSFVDAAVVISSSRVLRYDLPFPGNGNQETFARGWRPLFKTFQD